MLAAQKGHVDVIRALLFRGAHVGATDGRGWTALHFAAAAGQAEALRALLTAAASGRGALLEAQNGKGETPLALAAFGRREAAVRALLSYGARREALQDAGDKDYVAKLARLAGAAAGAADDVPAAAGGGGAGGQQSARSPGGPAMQFSGTASEYERIFSPPPSEPVTPYGVGGAAQHAAGPRTQAGAHKPAGGRSTVVAARAAAPAAAAAADDDTYSDDPDQQAASEDDGEALTRSAAPAATVTATSAAPRRAPDPLLVLPNTQSAPPTLSQPPARRSPRAAASGAATAKETPAAPGPQSPGKRELAPGGAAAAGPAGDGAVASGGRSGGGGGGGRWQLHELDYRGTLLLQHRPTGLLFTNVPEDSFPALVGLLEGGVTRWPAAADLRLLAAVPQVCDALAATVPVAALLLRRLRVIPDVVLRVCLCLGLHEVAELEELVRLDPDDAPAAFASAWGPTGLEPAHLAQLRAALLAALKQRHGDNDGAASASGPLPVALGGGALVQHLLERYGLTKLMVQVAELQITEARDLLVLAELAATGPGGGGAGGGAGELGNWESGRLTRLLRDLPALLAAQAKARDKTRAEAALGPALEAMVRQRRLEALARPSRGCLVLYDDLDLNSAETATATAAGSANGGRQDNRRAGRAQRVGVVVAEPPSRAAAAIDASASSDPMLAMLVAAAAAVPGSGGGEGDEGGGAAYGVRDLESGRTVALLGSCLRRVRAAELPKGAVRPDYAPPASLGPPVTPLSAAAGVLVTRGHAWGRGPAYDMYGEGVVGELVAPDPESTSAANGNGNGNGYDEGDPDYAAEDVTNDPAYGNGVVKPHRGGYGYAAGGHDAEDGGGAAAEQAAEPRWHGRWLVRWPDGQVFSYSVGEGGAFELSFLTLHWRAGAPLQDVHRGLLLPPAEVAVVPVARGPLWAEEPHDGLPGSPGAALLDRGCAGLEVAWMRDPHTPRTYFPAAAADSGSGGGSSGGGGVYPVVHAMLPGTPVTMFTARAGARVEPAPANGGMPQAMGGGPGLAGTHFYHKYYKSWQTGPEPGGPGTLLAPLRLEAGGLVVVWLVAWPNAGRREARVGAVGGDCNLVFAPQADAPHAKTRLPHEHWHHRGAEGRLVRLNPAQLALQPAAATVGPLRPAGATAGGGGGGGGGPQQQQRGQVGVVVRDLGPGVHCGLLVRLLGGAAAYWYDEDVLLPLTPVEVRRLPGAAAAALAAGGGAVPVLDVTAMPGMLVRRCYDDGSSLKTGSKEQQVGVLVAAVAPSRWLVRWGDGACAVYQTGAGAKFQLSYVCEHPQAGAPLAMPRTLDALGEMAVVPGFDCAAPWAAEAGGCDVAVVGGGSLQVDEESKLRLLVAESMPLVVGPAARQLRYSAGGLFRMFELAHAAAPGGPVTVFNAKQGLRVVLQTSANSGGATQTGTLTRPLRLGSKAGPGGGSMTGMGGGGGVGTGSSGSSTAAGSAAATPRGSSPARHTAAASTSSRRLRPESAISARSSAPSQASLGQTPSSSDLASISEAAERAGGGGGGGGMEVDRGTVMWEVSWDAGDTSVWAVGLSAAASALRVAPQPGFKSPAAPALRDASPRDRHLRVLDPVTYTPLPHGPRVLADHLYSLVGHLDAAVAALNAVAAGRLPGLWLAAAADCGPAAPYRVELQRVPMQGDTLLLSVGPPASAGQPQQGPDAASPGHLDPEAAQQLLAGSERAAAADAELAAAAGALEAALRGWPHLDLESQRAAERAAAADAESGNRRAAASDDGGGADGGSAVDNHQGRWIMTGCSFEDAVADAEASLVLQAAAPQQGGEDEGGVKGPVLVLRQAAGGSGTGRGNGGGSGSCSRHVAAALDRFNGALAAAQAALEAAAAGAGMEGLRYHVSVLPRPAAAAMPLAALQLRHASKLYDTDPLLVQEMIETFHSYTARLVVAGGASAAADPQQPKPAAPLGPLAAAGLDVAPELAAAAVRAHDAMCAYTALQASEWRHQITEMYGTGSGGVGGGAGSDAGAVEARRGHWHGLSLTNSSPQLVAVAGGVSVGDLEGLVEAREDAVGPCPSQLGARLNDCLLRLWRAAGRANGCGGSANVCDAVIRMYSYLHGQVAKAVASYGVSFMGADAGAMRQEVAEAAQQAAAAVDGLEAAASNLAMMPVPPWTSSAAAGAAGGGGGGGGPLAEMRDAAAAVWREVRRAAALAAGVAAAANAAAAAADEQSCKAAASATSEELLQDAAAAAAVMAAARWAASSSDGSAAAAEAAGGAACVVARQATFLAQAGGAAATPIVLEAAALAASLATLAKAAAAAAAAQQGDAMQMMKKRLDAAASASDALNARCGALRRQLAAAEAAAEEGGGGDERQLARLREELAAAQECASKADAHVDEAAESRSVALNESEDVASHAETAAADAARAAEWAADAAAACAAAAVDNARESAAAGGGQRDLDGLLALLSKAAAALAFASKVAAAAGISPPRSVSGAAEALATLAAEMCNAAVDQSVSGAEQLKEGAKEPDRVNAKQRTLGKAAAVALQLRSLATSHAALAPGGLLPAPAAASLARAAEGAAVACRDAADAAKAIGNDAVAKTRVAVGTKENLEHGARLQLELVETARAVADLAEVAAGASDGSRVREAHSDIAKALDDSDRELDKIDRYNREHLVLRAVAVAVGLRGLAAGIQRLPQVLDSAVAAVEKAAASAASAEPGSPPRRADSGVDEVGGGNPVPLEQGSSYNLAAVGAMGVATASMRSMANLAAAATAGGGGGGGGGKSELARARYTLDKNWQLVAEAERELRKSVSAGRELWQRSSSAAGSTAEVEDARSKAVSAAAAALGSASSSICGSFSTAVQSPEHLLRLHGLAEAVEDALRLLAEGLGLPRGAEGAAAAASQLAAASAARAAALEAAAAAFGGAAAAQRAAADPAAALLEAAVADEEPSGGVGGSGGQGGGDAGAGAGAGGEPTAEIVFRPVFVQTPSAAGASREPPHNAIQFHVAVLIKEPGRRAGPPPPEVDAVLQRPAVCALMEPLESLIEAANTELAAAAVALRDMAVEADLLAPLLGQPGGGALLRGSRDGPPGLQLALQRYGPDADALVRANLRQAGRYTSVLEAYRAVSSGLAEGLQEAAAQLGALLAPVPVPYHGRRVAQERAAAAAAAAAAEEEAARRQHQEQEAAWRQRQEEEAAAARAAAAAAAAAARPAPLLAPAPPPMAAGNVGISPRARTSSLRRNDSSSAGLEPALSRLGSRRSANGGFPEAGPLAPRLSGDGTMRSSGDGLPRLSDSGAASALAVPQQLAIMQVYGGDEPQARNASADGGASSALFSDDGEIDFGVGE
ncbi:hypothetical protein HXX76_003320 [Chlamydomonas incerta]|uniref:Uncharacterized protein n=1 Tax=Chlamydomonas incerta TaxID=51695 RepID=A0A835W8P6_CHLIN|nr:hypothetical protein HXX76_003320 [Chlamydomonas incerta]|eukprot:KAG2441704.1 hypothetical protein HXX76_003320 [Chlamydomonas incerta]